MTASDPRPRAAGRAAERMTVSDDSNPSANELEHMRQTIANFGSSSEVEAWAAGYRSATQGMNSDNCNMRYFRTPETSGQWENGRAIGQAIRGAPHAP